MRWSLKSLGREIRQRILDDECLLFRVNQKTSILLNELQVAFGVPDRVRLFRRLVAMGGMIEPFLYRGAIEVVRPEDGVRVILLLNPSDAKED